MPNQIYENGTTLGIEIETEFIPSGRLRFKDWNHAHDASIESDFYHLFRSDGGENILIERGSKDVNKFFSLFPSYDVQCGDEFVSKVFHPDEDDILENLKNLFKTLIESGEEVGVRSGIHFHVSLSGVPVSVYKNLIKLWLRMEDTIYLLAGMGKTYRGFSNNCAYARPLSGEGIYVPYKGKYAQLLEIPKLLDAKTTREFLTAFGDSLIQSQGRYYPVRYYGLNLSNIYNRGAVEFRPLNMCLNYKWVYSALEFFRSMVNYAILLQVTKTKNIPFGENIHSIYNPRSKEEIITDFVGISNEFKLDSFITENLIRILETSKLPVLDPTGIITHLTNRGSRVGSHWENGEYSPSIFKSQPAQAKIDDIHTRRGN